MEHQAIQDENLKLENVLLEQTIEYQKLQNILLEQKIEEQKLLNKRLLSSK